MKKEGISAFKISAAYIGTVVGAGFATGQEILQFFLRYGYSGLSGLAVSTALFIVTGYIVMDIGKRLGAASYREVLIYTCGNLIGRVIDMIMTFFLFGAFAVMIAGTGALFSQQLYLPDLWGCVLMAGLTAVTVLTGFKGVINSISFVVPFLLVSVSAICLWSVFKAPPDVFWIPAAEGGGLTGNWLAACILYVSYNIILSVAVLGPLGAEAKGGRALRLGSVLGGLGLGAASLAIFLAMSGNIPGILRLEIPMIYIAGRISTGMQFAFALVLIAEIYTTAVGSLFGFVSRFSISKGPRGKRAAFTAGATAAALLLSKIGFSNLVKYLYPLIGYVGIIFLVCLFYSWIRGGSKASGRRMKKPDKCSRIPARKAASK